MTSKPLTAEMERLREACRKVKDLLDDPQPGLSTWNDFLRNNCIELQSALLSLGASPEACGLRSLQLPEEPTEKMITDAKRVLRLAAIARKWCPDNALSCVSAIEEAFLSFDNPNEYMKECGAKMLRGRVQEFPE